MCYITGVLSALFILAATVCTFYEIFSAFFFDSMIEYHELKKYGHTIIKLSPGTQLKFIWDTVYFGIKTLFIFILLLLISIFFPITGQFLLILFMGYNLGISYMLCSANNCGMSIKELKEISNKKSGFIFGFGVTAYLLLLIPFTPLFMLPGLVLGGSELFNTQIRKGC